MKALIFALPILLAAVLIAPAQVYTDMVAWMKSTDQAFDTIRDTQNKTGPKMTGMGERIATVYENMIPFWRQRNAAGAVQASEQGKAFALQFAIAARAEDAAGAEAAFKQLTGTCRACHQKHRERLAPNQYRVK